MSQTSPFDFQPTLVGGTITLRPLKADDFEALYAAASDPLIWEQHPERTRYQRQVFENGFFAGALASGSAFVVINNASGEIIGSSRYYEWNPVEREVAVGFTFLTRSHWGGATNREIADTLVISARTVERHITHIYSKIGARGKADATAFALRHSLT